MLLNKRCLTCEAANISSIAPTFSSTGLKLSVVVMQLYLLWLGFYNKTIRAPWLCQRKHSHDELSQDLDFAITANHLLMLRPHGASILEVSRFKLKHCGRSPGCLHYTKLRVLANTTSASNEGLPWTPTGCVYHWRVSYAEYCLRPQRIAEPKHTTSGVICMVCAWKSGATINAPSINN